MNATRNAAPTRTQILFNTAAAWTRYGRQRLQCAVGVRRPAADTPHLLLLAWLFPPTISGGVYRPLSFVRHAASQGWKVTVVAGPVGDTVGEAGAYLASQLPDSVQVLRLPAGHEVVSHSAFPRIDGGFMRVLQTVDLVRSRCETVPSVVLASGPPFHNFAAGWMLAQHYRAPLVLDYRDEWTECPFSFVQIGNADLGWERRCLQSAAAVLMTSDSFIQHALTRFPGLRADKVHKVMNGWEPGDAPRAPPAAIRGQHPVEIAYLGMLGDHTPTDSLLADLGAVVEQSPALAQDLVLHFVGQRSVQAERQLAGFAHARMLRLGDQVPKPEAARIMGQASALLLINEPTLARYIPGKLFDYIASGTPVLVYGEGGESARIVQELHAGRVVAAGDKDALRRAIQDLAAGQVTTDAAKAATWLAEHTRHRAAERMLEVLVNVTRAQPHSA